MNYLQLTVYYEKAFESLNTGENFKTSKEVLKSIKNSYLESHRWPYYLDESKFKIKNILVNHYLFQRLWAEENGVRIDRNKNWHHEVVFHQIKKYKPEILFISSDSFFSPEFLKKIRTDFLFIKKIVLWQGVFLSNQKQFSKFKYVDHVLTPSKDILNELSNRVKVDQISFAFDKDILNDLPIVKKRNEILFLGSIFLERSIHGSRAELISELIKEFEFIKIYSNTKNYSFKNYFKNFILKLSRISLHKNFDFEREYNFYKQLISISKVDLGGEYFGIHQFKKLNESLFIINKHINEVNYAANIRIYEAAGVGSCLVNDHLKDLDKILDPDNEVVTYKSIDELKDKVSYLRLNPNKAIEIGENAKKKILNKHTFEIRTREFEHLITNNI